MIQWSNLTLLIVRRSILSKWFFCGTCKEIGLAIRKKFQKLPSRVLFWITRPRWATLWESATPARSLGWNGVRRQIGSNLRTSFENLRRVTSCIWFRVRRYRYRRYMFDTLLLGRLAWFAARWLTSFMMSGCKNGNLVPHEFLKCGMVGKNFRF